MRQPPFQDVFWHRKEFWQIKHLTVKTTAVASLTHARLVVKTTSTIATSIVHSKLDYCNSLYHNLPNCQLNRLQQIQNSLARAAVKAPKSTHITPILKSPHWLKVNERIEYKLLCLTYKVVYQIWSCWLQRLQKYVGGPNFFGCSPGPDPRQFWSIQNVVFGKLVPNPSCVPNLKLLA